MLFHRRFIEKKIAPWTIRNIYRKHGITKKKVVLVKKPASISKQRYPTTEAAVLQKIEASNKEGRIMLYTDEVMFTKHTNQGRDWSRMHLNIEIE